MKKHRIAKDVKEQIINRIKNDGLSVVQAAKEHGIAEGTIYSWIAKKTEGPADAGGDHQAQTRERPAASAGG